MHSGVTDPSRRASAPADALLGRVLDGRYQIDAPVGAGGVGAVYRGTHLVLGTPVAIKVLLPQYVHEEVIGQRFLREARAASLLRHPNALVVHDFGQDGDVTFMVMELIGGVPLQHLLGAGRALLPVARVARIMAQIADALAAAHAIHIVHRDLKPANVLVEDRATERDFVKVVDFGLARILAAPDRPLSSFDDVTLHRGAILGTPLYMAPEQCLGYAVSPATDVYALGAMLFELLTGHVPFQEKVLLALLKAHIDTPAPPVTRPEGAEAVPVEWVALAADALEKSPSARPPTAREFRDRLLAIHPGDAAASTGGGRDAPYAVPTRSPRVFEGTVAVVGDNFGARVLLEAAGIYTLGFADAEQVRTAGAVVVVLDVAHSAARTLEALRAVKRHPDAPPVLVITSDTGLETGRALLAAGAGDVAVPPLSGADLRRRMLNLTRRRR